MRAARFTDAGEPVTVTDVERPDPGPTEVLVEVRAASICGSDVHYLEEDVDFAPEDPPVTLGHEGAGVVSETGEAVSGVAVGDRVVVDYVVSCGHCDPCLAGETNRCRNRASVGHDVDGTFAEYVAVPQRSVVKMAESVPFEWGSVVGCAGSTGFHASRKADIDPGDVVAVFGVGGVGRHAVLWADQFGAADVLAIDVDADKLAAADRYGADRTVDSTDESVEDVIADGTDGWGVDAAIECSGSPRAMEQAVAAVDGANQYESGTVVSVGLQEEPIEVDYWGLREGVLTVSGDHTRDDLRRVLDMLATETVTLEQSVGPTVPLSEIDRGFDLVAEGDVGGRVLVDPSG